MDNTIRRIAAALTVCGAAEQSFAQSFTSGDLYLVSASLPGEEAGLVKIDPASWTVSVVTLNKAFSQGRGTYDPVLDRIVVPKAPSGGGMGAVDAAGNFVNIVYSGSQDAAFPASSHDGRIYFIRGTTGRIAFVDVDGATHEVLQSDGTTPYMIAGASATWYEAASSTLMIARGTGSGIEFRGLALDSAGTTVLSENVGNPAPVDDSAAVVAISQGPAGTLLVVIDDNTNNQEPRLQLLNPGSLATSIYASPSYFGVAAETTGAYLPSINQAVVLDTLNDQLRTFVANSTGTGAVVVTSGVSPGGGSGEAAQFIVIGTASTGGCDTDFNGDGFTDIFDFNDFVTCFEGDSCPTGKTADYNGDGFADIFDFNDFVTDFENGCG